MKKRQQKFADAEAVLVESLRLRRKLFEPDHRQIASSLYHLCEALVAQQKFADAESQLLKEWNILESRVGQSPEAAHTALGNIAKFYLSWSKVAPGKSQLAEDWKQKVVDFEKGNPRRDGNR